MLAIWLKARFIACYNLLKITMFKSFFVSDGKFYEQCDGVAMGFP